MLHYFTCLVKILQKQLIFHCKYSHAFISFKIAIMKYEYISKTQKMEVSLFFNDITMHSS